MAGNMAPLVSVITATYNWSSVLRYAIQSVLWQSLQDFEMLIIGDGCTDDSAEVVASFHDERLRWHNLAHNSGSQSEPNNVGLEMARAQFVAYLGHDDLWYPTHLKALVTALQTHAADVAYTQCVMIGPPHSGIRVLTGLSDSGQHTAGMWMLPSALMHKREMADAIGGWKDYRTLHLPPDADFFGRAFQHGKSFTAVNELTVFKFPSAWRRNSYRQRLCSEQVEYVRRIRTESDFLKDEWQAIAQAYVLGKTLAPPDAQLPVVPANAPRGWMVEQWRAIRGLEPNALDPVRPLPINQRIRLTLAKMVRRAGRALLRRLDG
jgi:glycosyltransferase involved in cell wall biosynthesis